MHPDVPDLCPRSAAARVPVLARLLCSVCALEGVELFEAAAVAVSVCGETDTQAKQQVRLLNTALVTFSRADSCFH